MKDEINYGVSHVRGDDWPHWPKLYEAEIYMFEFVYKRSFCELRSKEKYGTIRYEWLFPPGSRFSIRIPYMKIKVGKEKFDMIWCWSLCWVYRLWKRYGKWTLNRAVKKACKKWPEIKDELLADYDPEYL